MNAATHSVRTISLRELITAGAARASVAAMPDGNYREDTVIRSNEFPTPS